MICVWWKLVVACKNAFFNILYLLCYLYWNSFIVSMRVLVLSWIWGRAIMLKKK